MNLKQIAQAQSRRTFFKLSGLVLGSAIGGWGLSRVNAQATPPPTPAVTPTAIDAEVTPISSPAITPTVIEPDATAIEAQITPIVTPETSATVAAPATTSTAAPTVQTTLTPTATGTPISTGTPAGTVTVAATGTAGPGFVLPPLPYDYNALEPVIDATTMMLHHDRHHAAYVAELNTLLANTPNLLNVPPETLVRNLNRVPRAIRLRVRNNAGGHLNHSWFWQMMRPPSGTASNNAPTGALADAINRSFGSFEAFKTAFETAGVVRFGSGWVWLVRDRRGRLGILSTPNQDNPLMPEYGGLTPILGNDVWEHAYYLKYQNKRRDYLAAWWQVVNWDFAAQRFVA